jgi:hypothetical protein
MATGQFTYIPLGFKKVSSTPRNRAAGKYSVDSLDIMTPCRANGAILTLVGNEGETRMSVLRSICVAVLFVVCGLLANAHAAVVYSEGIDLSGDGNAPTLVNVGPGHNEIDGMTGNGDKDYFKIVVAGNERLDSLTVLPGTTILGAVSFIAIGAGDTLTTTTTTGLLGWTHYSPTSGNILPAMGLSSSAAPPGATGFTPPLGPGTYTFWVQDFNPGTATYHFDLVLSAVPEPEVYVAMLAGLALLALGWRRRVVP